MDEHEVCLHCGEATTTVDEGGKVVVSESDGEPAEDPRVFCSLEHAHEGQLANSSDDS